MTAADRNAAQTVAETFAPRLFARTASGTSRVLSSFTRPVRGGAAWVHTAPDGTTTILRVSPLRVMLDMQALAAGAVPGGIPLDGVYGPQTENAIRRMPLAGVTDPNLALVFEAVLCALYHQGVGRVTIPSPYELPSAARMTRITGDTTYFSRLVVSGPRVVSEETLTRTPTAADGTANAATVAAEIQRVAEQLATANANGANGNGAGGNTYVDHGTGNGTGTGNGAGTGNGTATDPSLLDAAALRELATYVHATPAQWTASAWLALSVTARWKLLSDAGLVRGPLTAQVIAAVQALEGTSQPAPQLPATDPTTPATPAANTLPAIPAKSAMKAGLLVLGVVGVAGAVTWALWPKDDAGESDTTTARSYAPTLEWQP